MLCFHTMILGQLTSLSKEASLYAGTDWLSLSVSQREVRGQYLGWQRAKPIKTGQRQTWVCPPGLYASSSLSLFVLIPVPSSFALLSLVAQRLVDASISGWACVQTWHCVLLCSALLFGILYVHCVPKNGQIHRLIQVHYFYNMLKLLTMASWRKRLDENLWIICHVPIMTKSVKGLDWTELKSKTNKKFILNLNYLTYSSVFSCSVVVVFIFKIYTKNTQLGGIMVYNTMSYFVMNK